MNIRDKPNYNLISKYRAVLMGIAIILIMFCHMDVAQGNNGVQVTALARVLHIFTVGVDIFMFLSGFGLYYSYTNHKLPYIVFEKKRMLRILPTYLIIAGITYTTYDLFIHHYGVLQIISDLSFFSWIKDQSTKYWNILAIIIFYLLFPVLYRIFCQGKRPLLKTVLFSICWWTVVELLSGLFPIISTFRIALARLPIFVIGMYFGGLSYHNKEVKKYTALLLIFCGYFIFAVMRTPPLKPFAEIMYYPGRAVLAISIISTIILFLCHIEDKQKMYSFIMGLFGWFGGLTLELYLLHQSYMILMEYPYRLITYAIAAFVLPTITAAMIYIIKRSMRKRMMS